MRKYQMAAAVDQTVVQFLQALCTASANTFYYKLQGDYPGLAMSNVMRMNITNISILEVVVVVGKTHVKNLISN